MIHPLLKKRPGGSSRIAAGRNAIPGDLDSYRLPAPVGKPFSIP
jgi:hypothetical protein